MKRQQTLNHPNTLNAHFEAGKLGVHTSSKRSISRSQVGEKLQSTDLWRIPVYTIVRWDKRKGWGWGPDVGIGAWGKRWWVSRRNHNNASILLQWLFVLSMASFQNCVIEVDRRRNFKSNKAGKFINNKLVHKLLYLVEGPKLKYFLPPIGTPLSGVRIKLLQILKKGLVLPSSMWIRSYTSWHWGIRYVGVIRLVFHVLQLLPITFMLRNLCCISKFVMKHQQKSDWKSDPPWCSYDYRKVHVCWFCKWMPKFL